MSQLDLVIYGEPVAQGRPKFTTIAGHPKAYDPAKSRNYKDYIRFAAAQQMSGKEPFSGAVALSVRVYRQMPQGLAKSKKKSELAETGNIVPTSKPDLDNYVKGIKDALKGICWLDDSAVVRYVEPFGKWYSVKPRIEVTVIPLEA